MRTERQTLGRLYLVYAETNDAEFAGLLPSLPLALARLGKRKNGATRVGLCAWDANARPRSITVDRDFALTAPWPQVRAVLLHEMVHVWQACMGHHNGYHDREFARMARRLGIKTGRNID